WRVNPARVWVAGREHWLLAAVNEATAEVKYFLSNAVTTPVPQIVAVAFRRWTVEHLFRLGKQEAGLTDFEGRDHVGLVRHLTLVLIVLGFVALHTKRLRGEKPGIDGGAGLPGAEPPLCDPVPAAAGRSGTPARQQPDPVLSAA
uniref:transposase n=1 Tax=Zavarzinella formosa TaxID=360055 RepID=UPI0005950866